MKKQIISFFLIMFSIAGIAQVHNKLLGTKLNPTTGIFMALDISSKKFIQLDTLKGVLGLSDGESTFDINNNRYFNSSNLGITVINPNNGAIIDIITDSININSIEYNPNSNTLLGIYWNKSVEILTSLNLTTKTFTFIDTLKGVFGLFSGVSTFDMKNNRYFIETNLGITIINAQSGAIVDTILTPYQFSGIEYDSNTNKLLGVYWNKSAEIFASLDISTKKLTNINTLNSVNLVSGTNSTYDVKNNRYFIETNLGITIINALSGAIIDTISSTFSMNGIEYTDQSSVGNMDQNNDFGLGVYPNPNNGIFTVNTNNALNSIEVYNLTGKLLYSNYNLKNQTSVDIDLSNLQKGIYFARIQDRKQVMTEKIIIQ